VNVPASATTTIVVYQRGSVRLDYSQMNLTPVTLSPATAGSFYQNAQANDPAVNDVDADWTKSTTAGSLNSTTYPAGHDVSKVVMRAAAMVSVGELGYIHTPTAWQYLTLQPGGGGGQIPDWAMLDLFTVGQGTAGRININSFIYSGAPALATPRLVPLKALLNSLSGVITPATVAANIYADSRTDLYGMPQGSPGVFDTIGEVCQISSLTGGGTTEADKEQAIRRIGNLITVRSNTFTIWALAQSIKQPPTNPNPGTYNPTYDVITGDVKAQAVVERYESTPGTPGGAVKYRMRYFRYLYN
jgi:hypothetical protein